MAKTYKQRLNELVRLVVDYWKIGKEIGSFNLSINTGMTKDEIIQTNKIYKLIEKYNEKHNELEKKFELFEEDAMLSVFEKQTNREIINIEDFNLDIYKNFIKLNEIYHKFSNQSLHTKNWKEVIEGRIENNDELMKGNKGKNVKNVPFEIMVSIKMLDKINQSVIKKHKTALQQNLIELTKTPFYKDSGQEKNQIELAIKREGDISLEVKTVKIDSTLVEIIEPN